ncbi:DsbA family protein [Maridesulfovibrio sp.]|uniref:DsbA family protein n=1 Tax=Maridesulfovibrio sp. TaxID=2795000 RepID=UPI002A18D03F|nr:thioredoxin domain-containing protein [Maridesulfovibrio sp.]
MVKAVLSVILLAVLWVIPAHADMNPEDSAELKAVIRQVLKDNPDLLFEALQGHEERLYDLLQVGLEKKNKAKIRAGRLRQLKNPKVAALHPERPVWGNPDGDISIIVFSDFQSATCSRADGTVIKLLGAHPEISYRFRHNPLGLHKMSRQVALYYEAIALQNHDKAKRFNHMALTERLKIKKNGTSELDRLAASCGVDMARLRKELAGKKVAETVDGDIREARKLGFTASPVFLVNGVTVTGAAPLEEFEEVIDMIRSGK